jgi:hypothetical protein
MTLDEIKKAVDAGKTVHWSNVGYVVVGNGRGDYVIKFLGNGHCVGLTWMDGVTMNGNESDFFIAD